MIVLTFDTDYVWEDDLHRFVAEFPFLGRGTFFLWQPFRGLKLSGHELAPHPFFSEIKPWSETLNQFHEQWDREAMVIRPHSCLYSHMLGIYLARHGYRGVSQATYLGQDGLQVYPHPWGIWELPIYYMDSMDLAMDRNWPGLGHRPFDRNLIDRAVEGDALYVFDFHPVHVALNTSSYEQWKRVRPKIVTQESSPFRLTFGGYGSRTFYEDLIRAMESRKIESVACGDVLAKLDSTIGTGRVF